LNERSSAPVITADGRSVAWLVEKGGKKAIFSAHTGNATSQEICTDCGIPRAWSPDGSTLLYSVGADLWSLSIRDGERKCLFSRAGYEVNDADFSPDGRWVAMVVGMPRKQKLQGILVPFDHLAEEERWNTIIEEDYNLALKWAAEGEAVYYLSRRDDFRCLYSQRLNVSDKRPLGPPMPVRHFHAYQEYPDAGSPIAVARDKVVLRLSSRKANIWAIDLPSIALNQ
jgi:Tol biopolymer transport system component